MKVSVIVPTYSPTRYDDMTECVEGILDQSYDDIEVVIVVDGNSDVFDRVRDEFGDCEDVVVFSNSDDAGPISRANMGVVQSSGELVVLTDDDAVPEPDWIERLVESYEEQDAIAVGGRIEPLWVAGEARYIPEEFYFLIGATHRGFPEEETEVRNTFGANLGFRRDVYLRLGGVKQGGIDPASVQGRETELCARMGREYGKGVIYNPDAVVYHRIYDFRCSRKWLLRRAFWQGYSKRAMEVLVPDSAGEESDFLRRILFEFVPGRFRDQFAQPTAVGIRQLVWLFLLLGAVGLGYSYGLLRWR